MLDADDDGLGGERVPSDGALRGKLGLDQTD